MKNRFLFRGKQVDSGRWFYGFLMKAKSWKHEGLEYHIMHEEPNPARLLTNEIIPETIGQCTGILAAKSCRGDNPEDLLLYDGDRVYISEWECETEVCWRMGSWLLKFQDNDEYLYEIADMCAIIGTIHDKENSAL